MVIVFKVISSNGFMVCNLRLITAKLGQSKDIKWYFIIRF